MVKEIRQSEGEYPRVCRVRVTASGEGDSLE